MKPKTKLIEPSMKQKRQLAKRLLKRNKSASDKRRKSMRRRSKLNLQHLTSAS